jgi:hypothetical protein
VTVRAVQAAQGVARWSRAWDGRRVHARGCPALSACSLGVRAVPPGHGRSLLPAVRAMGTTRTSYKRASFPTVVPMVPRLPGVLDTCYGPSMRADCLRKEMAMDHQLTGYPLKAGQLGYDCRYSKMHGMPVTGGRGFRGLKPWWYNGVPP